MATESRVKKSLKNAKVDAIFYALTLALTFFSRKIFLDSLGADFIGLTATLQNILNMLNLAELGISSAVAFTLYAPLQKSNRPEIEAIVSIFGFMYRRIGLVVMAIAIILSAFLPLIFDDTPFSLGIIYFAFYSYLFSSLINYFCNYRSVLLSADQKNYVVNIYFQGGNVVKILIQMWLAWQYGNYYVWVGIEMIYGALCCLLLNKKIREVYPWLNSTVSKGAEHRSHYPGIMKRTKQVFVHKIKDFLLGQSDQVLIYAFVSLSMVAYYGNYATVIIRSTVALTLVMSSLGAGVGNLVAEGNKEKIQRVFQELASLRYFIGGLLLYGIYYFLQPFICLWLGEQYLLPDTILYLMIAVMYISITRGAVDLFNSGYGLVADTWSAWTEGGLNLSISLVGGYYYGLPGLLWGKIVSLFLIVVLWKPYYLFRKGFHEKYSKYWLETLRLIFINAFSLLIAGAICSWFALDTIAYQSFGLWIFAASCASFCFICIQALLMYVFTPGFRSVIHRFIPFKRDKKAVS